MVWRTLGGNPDYPSRGVRGGLPAPRIDQRHVPGTPGAAPGPAPSVVIARIVIVQGTNEGLFIYNGQPALGNPPVLWAVGPGVTSDPFGNSVTPVLGVGTPGGPSAQFDAIGDLTLIGPDGSKLAAQPQANLPFSLTSALSGVMQTLLAATTTDVNQTQAGVISGIVLGTGTSAKMGTLITSPYGTQGMGLLLEAENDGSTDTAFGTLGTVTTQGGTLTFQPVLAVLPFAMILYGSGGTLTVVTKTSGSGTIPIPASVTVGKGECWGHGANGGPGFGVFGGFGGGGGGGGEYAAEPALALTAGGTAAYSVGGHGAVTTLTGSAVTVTANPGGDGGAGGVGAGGAQGLGGTGSTNTTHFAGARGGAGGRGGGGGGSSAGTSSAGNHGNAGGPSGGGAGGAAPSGGGAGGQGGTPDTGAGQAGSAPGGAAGGGAVLGPGGSGAAGQVRLTYTTGAPAILMSVASAAGTDQFGTAYQAGEFLADQAGNPPAPASGSIAYSVTGQRRYISSDGNIYFTGRIRAKTTGTQSISSTTQATVTGLSLPVAAQTYRFRVLVFFIGNSVNNAFLTMSGPATSSFFANVGFFGPAEDIFKQQTTIGSNTGLNSAPLANGSNYWAILDGEATFTATGNLTVSAASSANAASFTTQSGCLLELYPD